MPLQNIKPINDQLADIIVRADEPWIETSGRSARITSSSSAPSAPRRTLSLAAES